MRANDDYESSASASASTAPASTAPASTAAPASTSASTAATHFSASAADLTAAANLHIAVDNPSACVVDIAVACASFFIASAIFNASGFTASDEASKSLAAA